MLIGLLLPAAGWMGSRVGRFEDRWRRGVFVALAFGLLLTWAWLTRHPAVAVRVIPLDVLSRLEGLGAAPFFAFVIGVAWSMGELRRQRALVIMAGVVGAGYFLQGGLWMLQTTPAAAFAQSGDDVDQRQSQDYSCVPAACVTTLRIFGVQTDEAEMARLTETRPGRGATMIRAMRGLDQRLSGSSIRPVLVEPSYDELLGVQPPFMTPLRYEARQLHMVTVLRVDPHRVILADPASGLEAMTRYQFELLYHGQAIVFEHLDGSPIQPGLAPYWLEMMEQIEIERDGVAYADPAG